LRVWEFSVAVPAEQAPEFPDRRLVAPRLARGLRNGADRAIVSGQHSLLRVSDWRSGRGQGMDAKGWISAYAERLGTDAPTRDDFEAILELAAEAAHSSERVAAPVACWVAAKPGVPLDDALEAARRIDEGASPRPLGGA